MKKAVRNINKVKRKIEKRVNKGLKKHISKAASFYIDEIKIEFFEEPLVTLCYVYISDKDDDECKPEKFKYTAFIYLDVKSISTILIENIFKTN